MPFLKKVALIDTERPTRPESEIKAVQRRKPMRESPAKKLKRSRASLKKLKS